MGIKKRYKLETSDNQSQQIASEYTKKSYPFKWLEKIFIKCMDKSN